MLLVKVKVNQSLSRPGQALAVAGGSDSRISKQSAHEGAKFVSPTHQPSLPLTKYSWYSLLLQAESTPWPQCSRTDYVNENSNDIIGNRIRDLSVCSAVPQPNAPPRATVTCYYHVTVIKLQHNYCTIMTVLSLCTAKGTGGMAPRIPNLSSTFGDYPHAVVALSRGLGPRCSLGGSQRSSGCLQEQKNVLRLPGNEP